LLARVLLALVAVALAVVLAVETRRRNLLYWYDVATDYRYDFIGDTTTVTQVDVDANGFVWPEIGAEWDTAYLRLAIDSRVSSRWFEPSVDVLEPGGTSSRQTLERGARGKRYLEVCVGGPSSVKAGATIGLVGHHLRWKAQKAELVTFRNPSLDGRSILVVAPHPDDAEIAAFGTYSGQDAWIVTLTAGDYADGRYAHLAPSTVGQGDLRGRARAWDSVVVPLWGGLPPSRSIQLGFPNGSLRGVHDARPAAVDTGTALRIKRYRQFNVNEVFREREIDASWHGLVQDLVTVIETAAPEIIVTPHPALDVSSDHRFATLALFDALDRLGATDGWLLLYTNHLVHGEHYPFGPADARMTLPPWFDSELPVRGVLSRSLGDELRLDKAFALEAMHDLRSAPAPIIGGPLRRGLDRLARALGQFLRDPAGTYDYMRRAARPNEVFLVSRWEDREALRAYVERSWPVGDERPPGSDRY
jgi:LmbE family N-acetylglucosaminyl deacetylase